jgi:predicted O-linked N-acetylglucosamine transferase (SPINDLY family)
VLKPNSAVAFNNRGISLQVLKRFDEALASYDRAIALNPEYAAAFGNRGRAYGELRRLGDALTDFEKALALDPKQNYIKGDYLNAKMHLCNWSQFADDSGGLISAILKGNYVSQPFALLPVSTTAAIQRKCAELFVADRYPAPLVPLWRGERYAHERIRVGYVSGDLREHPVAVLAAGLFEHHDRSQFETIAISFGAFDPDRMTERLKGTFERFIDVRGRGDHEIAVLMRDLEIDIAVDLNGFTGDARPNIFAARPAPVAVNYLGYAGTLGRNYWDYIVADEFVLPAAAQSDYAEQVVYLPGSFMPNDDGRKISTATPSRSAAGLPEHGFVFCCFNNSYKFTPDVFDIWMRLLRAVEGSVLWLSASNDRATQNLRAEASKRGVSPERLIFASRVASNEDHLARLRLGDLFLDTLYYNAHTTACDALWAGLPVLTHPGPTFASRVAGSLLNAVGLPELIAPSLEDYEVLALKLAREPARLAAIKEKLARNIKTHPLFDTARFTRHMEAAYTTMWQRVQKGEPPKSFAVEPGA